MIFGGLLRVGSLADDLQRVLGLFVGSNFSINVLEGRGEGGGGRKERASSMI